MTELNETNIMAYAHKSPLLLISSAKNNSVESLKYLIKQGYDLTFVDIDSNTVLHHIVRMDVPEEEIIELFDCVFSKIDESLLFTKNREWLTVIELVTKLEKKKVLNYLITLRNILHESVKNGNIEMVNFLLFQEDTDVNCTNIYGKTPLHYVYDIDIAKLLLKNKADISKEDQNGYTPLHSSCEKYNIEITELLLENKANINKQNKNGVTPLQYALEQENRNTIKFLLENKADVNKGDKDGTIPLHQACRNNNIEIVKLLLENKADVNKGDNKGYTPLHLTCHEKNTKITTLLLENKADVDKENTYGDTPLHLACENREITTLLLENKADVDKKNIYGITPLLRHQMAGSDIYKLLEEHTTKTSKTKCIIC